VESVIQREGVIAPAIAEYVETVYGSRELMEGEHREVREQVSNRIEQLLQGYIGRCNSSEVLSQKNGLKREADRR